MTSIWTNSVKDTIPAYPRLKGSMHTDVLVVGGGLAGVLCAQQLAQTGAHVVLVEAKHIGSGVTANTTAKITAQHGAVYAYLLENEGEEKARLYYEGQTAALELIREMASTIPCDFEEKTAYVYTRQDRSVLEREMQAYKKLNIPFTFQENVSLPGGEVAALGMAHQGQFNPLQFLYGAAENLEIYENTFVDDIKGQQAVTDQGTISADHIILATHYPMVNVPGKFFMKLTQQRSYAVALDNAPDVDGMYIGLDSGKYSFRNYKGLLLVGGGNHKTGYVGGQYEAIRTFTNEALPQAFEQSAWATQDCMSLDGMPYIGMHQESTPHLLVASGFNKWGMTGAMLSAQILADQITKGVSDYDELFSPSRSMAKGELFHNAGEAFKGYLHHSKHCTHLGCALTHNDVESSWDCPCHGSRFDEQGEVLNNPAKRSLEIE